MIRLRELTTSRPVRITFHGTGAGHPSGDRFGSAATLRCDEGPTLLVDAGDSVPRRMIADGIRPESIDALFLSHTHPDHWSGIPGLVMAWDMAERTSPVTLFLPPSGGEFLHSVLRNSWLQARPRSYDLRIREYVEGEESVIGPVTVRPFATSHLDRYRREGEPAGVPYPAHMFRCAVAGTSILFSQDLGSELDLKPHLDGVDLLVCEASHVDLDSMARLALGSGVRVLVVTHIGPEEGETVGRFETAWSDSNENMRVIVAFDGMEIAIEQERI